MAILYNPMGIQSDVSDPMMHRTARRILDGARVVLLEDGFDALSLNRISEVSGTNRALIKYHFGDKRGLIEALVDSVVHDETVSLTNFLESIPPSERLEQFVRSVDEISNARDSFRVFFDLLPKTLRDEGLKSRMAGLYDWYVDAKLAWLGLNPRRHPERAREIVGLGELMVAVVDGIAIQRLVRSDFDASRPLEILELLLSGSWGTFEMLHESNLNPWGQSGREVPTSAADLGGSRR